jgi:hypothetical protein
MVRKFLKEFAVILLEKKFYNLKEIELKTAETNPCHLSLF